MNDLQGAVEKHASDWVDAAIYQDTSYFSLVDDASYLAKQQKNYDDWSRKDLEWDGEFMNASIDRSSAKFVEYGDTVGIEVMATTYIRGEMYTPDSESPGKSTAKSSSVISSRIRVMKIVMKKSSGFSKQRTSNEHKGGYTDDGLAISQITFFKE